MSQLHILIEGQSFGILEASVFDAEYYYCSRCAREWGSVEGIDLDRKPAHITCADHFDERSVYHAPGSMMDSLEPFLDQLSDSLLRREFWLHLQWIGALSDKEFNHEAQGKHDAGSRVLAGEAPHCPNFIRRHK